MEGWGNFCLLSGYLSILRVKVQSFSLDFRAMLDIRIGEGFNLTVPGTTLWVTRLSSLNTLSRQHCLDISVRECQAFPSSKHSFS